MTSGDGGDYFWAFPKPYADYAAPVVRRDGATGPREMLNMRWGIPGPAQFGGKGEGRARLVAG